MSGDAAVVEDSNIYSVTITQLLPAGPCGLVLAALMTSVAGALNSIATLATFDLYRRFLPDCSERQLVAIGRISGVVALILSIALVPLLDIHPCLFASMNDIISHVVPPITTVFVFGVLWQDANAVSACCVVR
jgi:solute:Na+ symporter, SSS family